MIDNMIAFRVLLKLVTPFKETEAYKLGIIDADGVLLRKVSTLTSIADREAYNLLNRLVFNLKRMLNKLPGGEHKLKNLAAAYFLINEATRTGYPGAITEARLQRLCRIPLAEDALVAQFAHYLSEDAPVNSTGAAVASDEPVLRPRKRLKRKELLHAQYSIP